MVASVTITGITIPNEPKHTNSHTAIFSDIVDGCDGIIYIYIYLQFQGLSYNNQSSVTTQKYWWFQSEQNDFDFLSKHIKGGCSLFPH